MSSVGDLTVDVKCDVSELTEGMTESRRQLETTTRNIEVQDATWTQLADTVAESAGRIAPEVTKITEVIAGLGGTIAAYRTFGSTISAVVSPLAALGSAFVRFGGIAASAIGFIVPQWKLVTTAVSASLLVYKVATSEMAQESYKAVVGSASVTKSIDGLSAALDKLGAAAGEPFGKVAAGTESLLQSINPFPALFGSVEKEVAGWIDSMTAGVEYVTPLVVEFADQAETAVFVTSSWGQATAEQTQHFYEQGKALREWAAESERIIAIQEAQRPLYQAIAAIQQGATDAAEQAAEVRRLGSIKTIDQLDAEIAKLQQKAIEEITTGKAGEDSQKRMAQLFGAIANQRQAILAGDVKPDESPVEKALESARKALYALEFGQDAAAVAALKEKGATDEQVASLEKLQEATKRLTDEKKHAKEVEDQLDDAAKKAMASGNKAVEDAAATFKKGEERVAALKDQLDLASGAATKADIAMREALREGFTEEQAKEIAGLTGQLDKSKQKDKQAAETQAAGASELGSSDALSSIFSNMRNGSKYQERIAKATEDQVRAQAETNSILGDLDFGEVADIA